MGPYVKIACTVNFFSFNLRFVNSVPCKLLYPVRPRLNRLLQADRTSEDRAGTNLDPHMRRTKLILNVCTIIYNASFSGGRGGGKIKIALWSDSVDWLDASYV